MTGRELDRLLRCSRWTRRRLLLRDPRFPKPIERAANVKLWVVAEVMTYVQLMKDERDNT